MVTFYHSDCGHLAGCDDPTFDLAAEWERRHVAYFEKSLTRALEKGTGGHRSDSPMAHVVHDALDMLAEKYPHATDDDVALVHEVFRRGEYFDSELIAHDICLAARPYWREPVDVHKLTRWNGSLALQAGTRLVTDFAGHPRYPAPGMVWVRHGGMWREIYPALRDAGIVGEIVSSTVWYHECPLLLGTDQKPAVPS